MKLDENLVTEMMEWCASRVGGSPNDIPMYWTFKLFHSCDANLEQLCMSLSDEFGMLVASPSWNRNPDYEVEGWVCKVGVVVRHTTASFLEFYEPIRVMVTDLGADIIEVGPNPVPKRPPKQDGWRERWSKRIDAEKRKFAQPALFITSLEVDEFQLDSLPDGLRSPFLKICDFELRGNAAYLADMRLGPTEDGISIGLNPGRYRVALTRKLDNGIPINVGFEFCSETEAVEEGELLGEISTDLATIGVYDQHCFRACFHHDSDSIFSWGEYAMAQPYPGTPGITYRDRDYGVLLYDLKRGHILPYATSGKGDGIYPVVELLLNKQRVGFRVWFES